MYLSLKVENKKAIYIQMECHFEGEVVVDAYLLQQCSNVTGAVLVCP